MNSGTTTTNRAASSISTQAGEQGAGALFAEQGTCPKPWLATINGEPLRSDVRGRAASVRRFKTEAAALKAASAAISKATNS